MSDSHLPPEINQGAEPPQNGAPAADQPGGEHGAVESVPAPAGPPIGSTPVPLDTGRLNVPAEEVAAAAAMAPVELPEFQLRSAEEADALRRKTIRNERVSSVMIAVLVHVLIGLGLALWALDVFEAPEVKIQARIAPPTETETNRPQVEQVSQKRPPSAPSASAKTITSLAPSAVHVPEVVFDSPVMDLGTSADIGIGFGTLGDGGFGGGQGGFGGLPGGMKGRCTLEERMKRLSESGGNKECEEAVVKSLNWLKSVQNTDGSFGKSRPVAMTGLTLLAYLGHCETPQSSKFGETVTKATAYLVERSQGDGGYLRSEKKTDAWVYEHVIAIYALGECLAFVNEINMEVPGLREAVEKGIDVLIKGQHKTGGWDYQMDRAGKRGGDTSIAGWALQALKAASTAGYGKDFGDKAKWDNSVKKGLAYLEKMQQKDGYLSYKKHGDRRGNGWSLNGLAPLCFQIHGKSGRVVSRGINATNKVPVKYNQESVNLYAWYYITQTRFLRGGSAWERWNRKWRDELLKNQESDGRWKREGGKTNKKDSSKTRSAGRDEQIYRNTLCTLMLEVYYRFLPGTSGAE